MGKHQRRVISGQFLIQWQSAIQIVHIDTSKHADNIVIHHASLDVLPSSHGVPVSAQSAREQREPSDSILLDGRYRDRQLKGDARRFRELHIQGDWLLVYRVEGEQVILARTGTHDGLSQGWTVRDYRAFATLDSSRRVICPCDSTV
ncbi:type II toxin-antitoxin system YafQ family toxin [Bifidobacterium fermentum]|uniref:type II toxin-antitoxin system YafQ family toxin n=1 Tax=Bifidobacterium TaxID=1678 RepID=UPI0034E219C8